MYAESRSLSSELRVPRFMYDARRCTVRSIGTNAMPTSVFDFDWRRFDTKRVNCCNETVLPVPGPARTSTPWAPCMPCARLDDDLVRCSVRSSMLEMPAQAVPIDFLSVSTVM